VEWYEGRAAGLEQGFTIATPPPCPGPLSVELALAGGLEPTLARGEVELRRPDGTVALRYAELQALDAAGRTLRSWLALEEGRLAIRVDARDAAYPVVIDPLLLVASGELQPEGAAPAFGTSIAIQGDQALVAASGSGVFVYGRDGDAWVLRGKLTEMGASAGFGTAVAFADGRVLVGDPTPLGTDGGVDSVWAYSDGGTTQLVAPLAGAGFGTLVAGHGPTIAVGAPNELGDAGTSVGAVFVYRDGTGPEPLPRPTELEGALMSRFGDSLAASRDIVAVGAPWLFSGPIYVYEWSATGAAWSHQATLGSDGGYEDEVGWSLAMAGETILGGNPQMQILDPYTGVGVAAIHERDDGGAWQQRALWRGPPENLGLGASVALAPDLAAVGMCPSGAYAGTTSVALFLRAPDGSWPETATAEIPGSAVPSSFGCRVAAWGDTVLVADTGKRRVFYYLYRRDLGDRCTADTDCLSGACGSTGLCIEMPDGGPRTDGPGRDSNLGDGPPAGDGAGTGDAPEGRDGPGGGLGGRGTNFYACGCAGARSPGGAALLLLWALLAWRSRRPA
jgi:hypothetical protein